MPSTPRQIAVSMMFRGETATVIQEHPTPLYASMITLLLASESWSKLDYAKMVEEALQLSGITLIDWCSTLEDVLVRHVEGQVSEKETGETQNG